MRLLSCIVPVVESPGSPVWHLRWPWGTLQCWRKGDTKWSVSMGKNVGLHVHAGRLEAWTARKPIPRCPRGCVRIFKERRIGKGFFLSHVSHA